MKNISIKIAKLLVGNNKSLYVKMDYIRYGVEIILMSLIGVLGMLIISLIMNENYAWIPFLVSFALLRTSAGGYHAKNAVRCLGVSETMFFIALFISIYIDIRFEFYVISFCICFLIVLIFAPIESEKKRLSNALKEKNNLKSIVCMVINFIVIFGIDNTLFKELYFLGMLFAVGSMIFVVVCRQLDEIKY